jgi:hypothetical protein
MPPAERGDKGRPELRSEEIEDKEQDSQHGPSGDVVPEPVAGKPDAARETGNDGEKRPRRDGEAKPWQALDDPGSCRPEVFEEGGEPQHHRQPQEQAAGNSADQPPFPLLALRRSRADADHSGVDGIRHERKPPDPGSQSYQPGAYTVGAGRSADAAKNGCRPGLPGRQRSDQEISRRQR